MKTAVGVFRTRERAERAAGDLRRSGFSEEGLNLLFPGDSSEQVRSVPTSDMERPGMGKAVGGVLGAALGAAGGLEAGAAVASAFIPGVGPVMAVGLAAAALLGAGGGIAGAAAGAVVDRKATEGLPADELFFYEDALRHGRSVVVVLAEDGEQAARARDILAAAGAETLDAAREAWWIGLRGAEEEHYRAGGRSFASDESVYRQGFEAALRREARGKSHTEAADYLGAMYPEVWRAEAFRRGYARGREYYERHCARAR